MESNEESFNIIRKKSVKKNKSKDKIRIDVKEKPPRTSKGISRPRKLPSLRSPNMKTINSYNKKKTLPPVKVPSSIRNNNKGEIIKAKDTTPQICNLFYFPNSNNIYLFIPNSKYPPNEIENLKSYEILFQMRIPPIYKIRMFKYSNMPECITNSIKVANMKLKTKLDNSNIIWRLLHPNEMRDLIRSMDKYQKFNHFPTTYQLGRKDNMYRHHKHFKSLFPKDYDFAPLTFILPFDSQKFEEEYATSQARWIVKPVNLSRGRGVHLLKDEDEYQKILKASYKLNITQYLISKYIAAPHLINEIKYDLRIYVLITSFNPLKIYLYRNGLVRFATEKYTKGNYDNVYVHLTNYSINKNNTNYKNNMNDENGEEDNSSKWSLYEYRDHFQKNEKEEVFEKIWSKIKDIVIKTIITVKDESAREVPYTKLNCLFELYGFDIMIDKDYKPWLIEVNVNPSLHCTSPLDLVIKSDLIGDVINIVGVTPYHHKIKDKVYNIFGTNDEEEKEEKKEKEETSKTYMATRAKIMKEFSKTNLKAKLPEFDGPFYKNMINYSIEEVERSKITDFECIFPLKSNIEQYSKFIIKEGLCDCDLVYWQYLLTNTV